MHVCNPGFIDDLILQGGVYLACIYDLAIFIDPEDEDGMFPYMSFLDRLTGKA